MAKILITSEPSTGMAYIKFQEGDVYKTVEFENINIDIDKNNNCLGLELFKFYEDSVEFKKI